MDGRVLALYAGVGLLFLMPMPLRARTDVIQTSGDAYQHMWWLWWVKEALHGRRSPYFTDRLFHPTGVHLYLSPMDNLGGLLSVPLQHLFGLVPAYNMLLLAGAVFSALAMFQLGREVTRSYGGAIVAGAAFGFSPLMISEANMGHLEWTNLGFLPLAVLCLIRLQNGPAWIVVPRTLALSLAMLVTWYQGLFVLLFAALFGSWRVVAAVRRRDWAGLRSFCLRFAAWNLLGLLWVAPLLLPTIRAGAENEGAVVPREWVARNSARPLDPFRPNALHPALGSARAPWIYALGYTSLILAVLGVVEARARAVFWLLCLGAFYLLSLGPILRIGGYEWYSALLPYNVLYSLPLGRIPRTPVRFLFVVSMATSVLAAWGVARLQRRMASRGDGSGTAVAAVVLAILLVENLPIPRPVVSAALPSFYEFLGKCEPGAVLELPRQGISKAMYGQTAHGMPIVGGYVSRHAPEELRLYEGPVLRQLWTPTRKAFKELRGSEVIRQPALLERVPQVLDAYGLRYVVLHLDQPPRDQALRLKKILGRALPESAIIWDDNEIRAYRVPEQPGRRGVVLGMGVEWGPSEGSPDEYQWCPGAGNVVLMLLDRSAREVLLQGSAISYREPVEIDVDLNGRPWTNLHLVPSPQPLLLPLPLQPGYNVVRLRAQGTPPRSPDGRPRSFALGALRVHGED